jgi:predicted dienelactone hydrolase
VRSPLIAIAIVSTLVVAACSSDDAASTSSGAAQTTTVPEPVDGSTPDSTTAATTPTTDAPVDTAPSSEPLEILPPGPYDVGVTTITINADSERPLTVDVWFPLDDAGAAPAHEYTLIPGLFDISDNAVDAEPAAMSADGPFPLVIYSHGSGGLRYIASDYTEAIASYGYIVASADHTGNTVLDDLLCTRTTGSVTALNRVNDIQAIIDSMLDQESSETVGFGAYVDPESIAVTGHSVGGFTALAAVTGYENDLGSVAADGRVDAVIPLAPAIGGARPPLDQSSTTTTDPNRVDRCADPNAPQPTAEEIAAARSRTSITDEQLASITVPAMVLVGADDSATPVEPNVTRLWEFSNSDPLYRVELVAGQHQSFTNACRYVELLPTWPADLQALTRPILESQAAQGCGDGIMDIQRAQDLTNTFAITFLDSVFRGRDMIDPASTDLPDDVIFMSK